MPDWLLPKMSAISQLSVNYDVSLLNSYLSHVFTVLYVFNGVSLISQTVSSTMGKRTEPWQQGSKNTEEQSVLAITTQR